MRNRTSFLLASFATAFVLSGSLGAQTPARRHKRAAVANADAVPAADAAPAPADPAAKKELLLPDGTAMTVITTDELSSGKVSKGDQLVFRVGKPVIVNNSVLIAEGTVVKASVLEASGAGHFGRGGKLSVNIESTKTVDGQSVKLRAGEGKEGDSNIKSTVLLTAFLGPIGLFKKGDDAVIKAGTEIKVYTDQDVKVVMP